MTPPAPSLRSAWPAALLFVATLSLFWRTSGFDFLNYDDDTYVTANAAVRGGLSGAGLGWAFATGHAANWHPLTWLSHQLDVELFGLDSGAHHRTNVLLHALNAALCFAALRALTGASGKSAMAAALFALHPLRVESVAWVAERKDLLAGTFGLASLWAYAGYARSGGSLRYGLCLALFALGLLAKPMLVTLPCLFLVLDHWPLARLDGREPLFRRLLLREKLPFLALAAGSALVTLVVQQAGGAFGALEHVPFGPRLVNALRALGLYLATSFAPSGQSVFHPHPFLSTPQGGGWSFGAGLGLAAAVAWVALGLRLRRRAPELLTGAAWFLGMLVPVLGLLQVGLQGWAERYTYLPSIGLALSLTWALDRWPGGRARAATLVLAGGALAALAWASARALEPWRNSRTLFEHALRVEESVVAHTNLARALEEAGELAEAERHFARAAELAPRLAGPRLNRARVLVDLGRASEAEPELRAAVLAEPGLALAHANLGWILVESGDEAEGCEHLRRALALEPEQPAHLNNLAWVLATGPNAADASEALALAERLVAASRGTQPAHLETLAAALARLERFEEAVLWQTRALERVRGSARPLIEERLALYRARKPFLRAR
jgi:tetratricopeptide (TPR) repeat protein